MSIFNKYSRTFWVANAIELFERWGWYGFFMLFANYLTGSSDAGGLEFSQTQKGLLMGVGTGILYFLPVLTGAIADRFGYKRILFLSFLIYVSAFILLPSFTTFTGVFLMYLYLAVGAALFKPIISATVAKTTTDETASIGFGIFYMMVNIGAFFGPLVTLLFKGSSHLIFYASAAVMLLNFVLLLFYKEPVREEANVRNEPLLHTFALIFRNMGSLFHDMKFLVFLLIVAGFWTMYNQLFFTLPVFISQWVDTSILYDFFQKHVPFICRNYSVEPGVMDPEFVTNIDALYIILFQVLISGMVMKMKPLRSMMSGFLICAIGMSLTLVSRNVMFMLFAILIFSIGEMSGSPKITEYIGRIAPPDKKALYMGYSFIPVFLGNVLAGFISGHVYQQLSDKVMLVHRFAEERGYQFPERLSNNAYFDAVAGQAGMTPNELTLFLWNRYAPSRIWMVVLGIGILSSLSLFIYDRYTSRKQKI